MMRSCARRTSAAVPNPSCAKAPSLHRDGFLMFGWLLIMAAALSASTAAAGDVSRPAGTGVKQAAQEAGLDRHQVKNIEQGHVLDFSEKVKDSPVMMGRAVGIIDDTPEAALFVLSDLSKYQFWASRVTESRLIKQQGLTGYAVIETDLPWPAKDAWAYIEFTRTHKDGRIYEIRWRMLNGTLKQYSGFTRVEPWNEEGTRTLMTYELLAEPNSATPDAIISKGVRSVARVFIQRLRLRLKALRRFNKIPRAWDGH